MRLLESTSPEIAKCFESGHYLIARRPAADFHGFAGNVGILLFLFFLLAATATSWMVAVAVTIGLLIAWNLVLKYRASFGRQAWIVLVCQKRFYLRLFSPRSRALDNSSQPNVIALDADEIAAVGVHMRTVWVYGPKPRIVEGLMIEPAAAVRASVANVFQQLAPPPDT